MHDAETIRASRGKGRSVEVIRLPAPNTSRAYGRALASAYRGGVPALLPGGTDSLMLVGAGQVERCPSGLRDRTGNAVCG